MNIAIAFMFALFGLVIGSFLNVVIDRLPAGESIAFPPSHCSSCKHHLAAKDLVPVVSYAFLKGRCRYCGEHITIRIPIVEAATAIAFGLLFLYFKLTPELAIAIFYFCLLLAIAVIDLETSLILRIMIIPSIIFAIAFSLLLPHSSFVPQIRSALIGGGIGLGVMLLIFVLAYLWYHREAFGFGDVYLGTLMGVMLGTPRIVVGILSAVYVGAIIAIILVAIRKKGTKQPIAFGEFLAIGTAIAFIWGIPIWNWYSNFFKF